MYLFLEEYGMTIVYGVLMVAVVSGLLFLLSFLHGGGLTNTDNWKETQAGTPSSGVYGNSKDSSNIVPWYIQEIRTKAEADGLYTEVN